MVNWKDISAEFNTELQQKWENEGFNYEEVSNWIKMGFKPDDFAFISFIKTFDYNHQNPLSSTEIENLRSMYQDNLVQESTDVVEDMAEQEAIRQSFVSDPSLKEVDIDKKKTDSGWLTDDNITYILNNHERIQEAIKQRTSIQVRTDIANIYFHYEKNKSEEEIRGFVKELNLDKFMYTFLPLRVNGNHWGLLIDCGGGNDFYYVSSSREESNKTQVERIEGFLKKFNPQAKVEVISTPSRQSNSYDCGVYLIFYVWELMERYDWQLRLDRRYTEADCQRFRAEWKEKVGQEKWCKVDDKWEEIGSENGFKKGIVESLKSELEAKKRELAERMENEKNMKEIMDFRNEIITELQTTIENLQEQLLNRENDKEKREFQQELFTLQERTNHDEKEIERLTRTIGKLELENKSLKEKVGSYRTEIRQKKETELVDKIKDIKIKLKVDEIELVEELFEAHHEATENSNSYAQKQLAKFKQKLLQGGKVSEKEIEEICQKQAELIKLEKEVELSSQIEVNKIKIENKFNLW